MLVICRVASYSCKIQTISTNLNILYVFKNVFKKLLFSIYEKKISNILKIIVIIIIIKLFLIYDVITRISFQMSFHLIGIYYIFIKMIEVVMFNEFFSNI